MRQPLVWQCDCKPFGVLLQTVHDKMVMKMGIVDRPFMLAASALFHKASSI
jgi:hypothetical protein